MKIRAEFNTNAGKHNAIVYEHDGKIVVKEEKPIEFDSISEFNLWRIEQDWISSERNLSPFKKVPMYIQRNPELKDTEERRKAENEVYKLFEKIITIYKAYNPDGEYLTLDYNKQNDGEFININNRYWEDKKPFYLNKIFEE